MVKYYYVNLLKFNVHKGTTNSKAPLMNNYVYGTRKSLAILNLVKFLKSLKLINLVSNGLISKTSKVLFYSTDKFSEDLFRELSIATNSYFLGGDWVPGTLTNKSIIGRYRINKGESLVFFQVPSLIFLFSKITNFVLYNEISKYEIPIINFNSNNLRFKSLDYSLPLNIYSLGVLYFFVKYLSFIFNKVRLNSYSLAPNLKKVYFF